MSTQTHCPSLLGHFSTRSTTLFWSGQWPSNKTKPYCLQVYKFTRRLTRDTVSNSGQLTSEALGLPSTSMVNRILIFPHLMLRLQDLLRAAKEHQNAYNYKWCKAKETGIFLCKTVTSGVIRLKSINCPSNLRMRESSQLQSD